jgi:hypothetical protein
VLALQHASMNIGAFHLFQAEQLDVTVEVDEVAHVELSLHHLYRALSLSAQIQPAVQTTCVAALQRIFAAYCEGEEGQEALDQLRNLYPIAFASSQKIGVLKAILVGQVEMESL